MTYVFPTVIIAAIAAVAFFSDIKVSRGAASAIKVFSPCVLGIYIIHENPIFRENVIMRCREYFNTDNALILTAQIIFTAVLIFFGCFILENVRIALFKLAKIEGLCKKIDDYTENFGARKKKEKKSIDKNMTL